MNNLPTPVGYKMLVKPKITESVSKGGIILHAAEVDREQLSMVIGQIISMGEDCYRDTVRYPNGAWCKVGDWVMYGRYTGSKFQISELEYRLINDDEIIAVTDEPINITYG